MTRLSAMNIIRSEENVGLVALRPPLLVTTEEYCVLVHFTSMRKIYRVIVTRSPEINKIIYLRETQVWYP